MSIEFPETHQLHSPCREALQQLSSYSQLLGTERRDLFYVYCTRLHCLHSNRGAVVLHRSKLDTALECAPLFSQGQTVYLTVSAVKASNLQRMSRVAHKRWVIIFIMCVGSQRRHPISGNAHYTTSPMSSFPSALSDIKKTPQLDQWEKILYQAFVNTSVTARM